MNKYLIPIFARGSGIGTRLFPWARCVLHSKNYNGQILRPNWVQPRIGPMLRGGIDYKSYHRQILLYGLFNVPESAPSLLRELKARFLIKQVEEDYYLNNKIFFDNSNEEILVKFKGDKGRFTNLNGYDVFLKEELFKITKYQWRTFIDTFKNVPIGINIRLGNDFKKAGSFVDHYNHEATQTPVEWFANSLISVRKMVGHEAAAYIVTDGTEDQLKCLMELPNTHFVRPGCAISDLLILSKSKILLRSGGSSFSAWASFLGQMITISHPGQSMNEFNMINKHNFYTGEFMPNIFNKDLFEDIKKTNNSKI
jgi:hypothetical protein